MKVLLIAVVCGLISVTTGCCRLCMDDSDRVFDELAKVHAESVYQKYGLIMNMTGGGGSDGKYTKLDIGFIKKGPLTIDQSRRIMVEGITEFLEIVNSEEMTSELTDPPFGIDRIEYEFYTTAKNGAMLRYPDGPTFDKQVSYVFICKGSIYYTIAKKRGEPFEDLHIETFEEAKQIIERENQQL